MIGFPTSSKNAGYHVILKYGFSISYFDINTSNFHLKKPRHKLRNCDKLFSCVRHLFIKSKQKRENCIPLTLQRGHLDILTLKILLLIKYYHVSLLYQLAVLAGKLPIQH